MTDHIDVPIVANGDWIDAAWINQYIGDNLRAVFQGLANPGSIPYAVDADTVGELAAGAARKTMRMNATASAPEWADALLTNVRRRGGSASDWSSPGDNNYTPAAVKIQCGVANLVLTNGIGVLSVAFPEAFSTKPIVMITKTYLGTTINNFGISDITTTSFSLVVVDTNWNATVPLYWLAIGPG